MTDPKIINYPVKSLGPFDSDEIEDRAKLKELFENFPVLNHFVWSYRNGDVEGSLVRTALMMAEDAGGYNSDTNLALRKLLEARALYRHTFDRVLIDNPHWRK